MFNPRVVIVDFVEDKMALDQVLLQALQFSHVIYNLSILLTYLLSEAGTIMSFETAIPRDLVSMPFLKITKRIPSRVDSSLWCFLSVLHVFEEFSPVFQKPNIGAYP
jgi:hypothetical protein